MDIHEMVSGGEYHRISPTVQLVAYARQFTDIPFAKEIAEITGAKEIADTFIDKDGHDAFLKCYFPIFLEARYKSTWNTLTNYGIKQVLEFASGLSFRGPIIAPDNLDMVYVETDLPNMSQEKLRVMAQIPALQQQANLGNVFFSTANALVYDEIEPHLQHFSLHKPLGIICEGLLMYLTVEEKRILAKNCRKLLEQYGGVWITPDLATKSSYLKYKSAPNSRNIIQEKTGRSFAQNCFDNDDEMQEFFSQLGFKLESKSQLDGSFSMSCRNILEIPDDVFNDLTSDLKTWVISLK